MATERFPKRTQFHGTWKQNEVMRHVLAAADRGEFLYLTQLNQLISWGPIKLPSLTTIVRGLQAHGFVKRMYGRNLEDTLIEFKPEMDAREVKGLKQFIVPTPAGYNVFRPIREPIE